MQPKDDKHTTSACTCSVCGREFPTWKAREDHIRDTGHVHFLRERNDDRLRP